MSSPLLRLRAPTALEYFAMLVAEDASLNLTEAAIAIGQDETPTLNVQSVSSEIDVLAHRLRQRLPPDAPAAHRLRLLVRYFYGELGFAGNVNDYYATGNSYLHQVLATRRGIPISLAVLFLELAQQIGLKACGIGFPGHFLLRLRVPQGEVLLDPLTGESLSRQALDEASLPYRAAGRQEGMELPLEHFLRESTPRQTLARMLRNLQEIHRAQADWLRLLTVQQRLLVLLPDDARELRNRAQALEALGHWGAAADDLERCLMLQPNVGDGPELQQRVLRLRGRAGPRLH